MNCPICADVALVIAERQSIEVDYCPRCRGVWLDRGELDKIIERAAGDLASRERPSAPPPERSEHRERDAYRGPDSRGPDPRSHDARRDSHGDDPRRRKRSFLSDLFDFD